MSSGGLEQWAHQLDVTHKRRQREWQEAECQHRYHAMWQDDATEAHHPKYGHREAWQPDNHLDHNQGRGACGTETVWMVWT